MKKLFESSRIPANAFHQVINEVINPITPLAFVRPGLGEPSGSCWKWATVSRRKVISRNMKSEKKATFDLKVQSRHMMVKKDQPARKNPTARFISAWEWYCCMSPSPPVSMRA